MNLEDRVSEREYNLESLAWLEHALEQARTRGRRTTEDLFETVLAEVVFELDLLTDPLENPAGT